MADVINRTTKQYLKSVNTPDYPTEDWIINPDLSALGSVAQKYWKIVDDTVVEMDAGEKVTEDASTAPPVTDVSGVWVTAAPANDAEAIQRIAAAVKAIGGPIK